MRTAKGANLRAVPVAPGSEVNTDVTSDPNQIPEAAPGGADDLMSLPDAPQAQPIKAGDSSAVHPPNDDLDDLPDSGGSLGKIYQKVYHGDPDNVAQVIDTSNKLGADPAMVAGSLKDAKKAADGPDASFFQSIEARFPGTTKFLQTPQNMAMAHDDMNNLAQHESLIQRAKDAFLFEKNAFVGGALQEELSFLRYQQMEGGKTASNDWFRIGGMLANDLGAPTGDIEKRAQWVQGQMDQLNQQRPQPGQSSWIKRGLYGATEFLPQVAGGAIHGAKGAAALGIPAAIAGAATGPGDIPITDAAMKVGFAAGEAQYNYKLMAGMAYDQMLKVTDTNGQPLPQDIMVDASRAIGAAGGALSLVKLDALFGQAGQKIMQKMLGDIPPAVLSNPATRGAALATFAKNYLGSVATGTAVMTGITGVNIAGERVAEAASGQKFDHSKEPGVGEQLANTMGDAALTMGVMGFPGAALGLHYDMQAAKRAESAKNFYLAMGETAEASKVRTRLPEAHQEFIKGLTADGPVENVYIPQEAFASYFQSKGIDPVTVARELGIESSYGEAANSGGDVKVPLDVWASKVAGTEHYQGLAEDIKFDPQDLTARQVEDRKAEIREQIKKVQEQAAAGGPAEVSADESSQRVYDDRFQQLKDVGATDNEARVGATLHQSAFRTLGERTGIAPHELAEKFKLEVQRRESIREAEGKSFDDATQAIGDVNPHGEVPTDLPSYATGEQKFMEQIAPMNAEIEKLTAGEQTPENKARIEELQTKRKELMQAQQNRTAPGGTFYQDEDKNPRGRITFMRDKAVIDLFKDANRSTFLHESGHYFLEIVQSLANEENTPGQIKTDLKVIRDWMGLKDGEEIGTAQHEQFARGFEAYLMEGKAPSEALRMAFTRFKSWLLKLYKSVRGLNVELSPEIRSVMDRILATDEEIKNAASEIGFDQSAGMEVPKGLEGRMNSMFERARERAESQLLKEQMAEISESNQKFMAEERVKLRAEAEAAVEKEPVFRAQRDIQEAIGPRKDVLKLAERIISDKVKTRPDLEAATHFEISAQVNGFDDGKDLANAMLEAHAQNSKQRMIDAFIGEGMRPHQDMMNRLSIKEQALRAIHNEHMTELLALERQILHDKVNEAAVGMEVTRRQRIEARVAAAEAKDQANKMLADKPLKDAGNYRIYTTAERNAAVKAAGAIRRGEMDKAAEYKRQQMLSHALAAEAMRNRGEAAKALKLLNKASKRGEDMKDMPLAFNRQIDQLLEKFGIKEKSPEDVQTLTQIARDMQANGDLPNDIANATGIIADPKTGELRPEGLRDFVQRQNENFYAIQLPASIVDGPGAKSYRSLKMGDLRDLTDAVKTLTKLGKAHDRWMNDFIQITMNEAGDRLKASLEEKIGKDFAHQKLIGTKFKGTAGEVMDRIKNLPNSMMPTMVNMLTTCTYLDGGDKNGPAHDYIYRPLKQAEDRKFGRIEKMRDEVAGENGLFSKFYEKKELAGYKEKVEKLPNGQWLTREEVLSMALNWGNEQNRDRIRAGFGSRDESGKLTPMSDEQIHGLFDKHLQAKDWHFAQAVWDHLETYWPEIAALEMKVRGVEPERVVSAPFENQHGSFGGGYYPISYDFEKSDEAYKNQQQLTEEFQQYSSAAAHTERGHAIARVAFVARPVKLSLSVLFNHLENVIHDLEFRAPIIDAAKFLQMPDVRNSLQNAIGMDGYRGINDWLKSMGQSQTENLTWLDKALQWSRFGTTISALGLTPKAFLLHAPSNVFNAMWETGVMNTTRFMTQAAVDAAMGRGGLKEFVFSKSERMNQRLTVRDRDIMEMAKQWQGTSAGVIPHYAFMSLHLADEAVSIPLWADTYRKNVAEFGEAKATEIADETVTRTLGSGSKVDQIGFQRGSQKTKLFTMFYSWMSVMFNRAWLDGKMAGLEYKQGNLGQAASIIAKATFWAWILPAAHEALLQEAMHNGPSTDEERKKRMIGKVAEAPFGMLPFVRDIVPLVIHEALGEHGSSLRLSPVESAWENIFKPAADTTNIMFGNGKHLDEKYAEEVARGMSQVAGYPQQLNTWAFNFWDYVQGNGEASMKDFLSRRRKK